MNRRRLDEITERVAALEAAAGVAGDATRLDSRLEAIESAIRHLRHGGADLDEIDDAVRRLTGLVSEHVPVGARVALVSEGDPDLFTLPDRPIAVFGRDAATGRADRRFDHGAAAIAHLEALRVQDTRFLLLPEPARSWMQRYPEFAEHLLARYEVVADEPGVGLLFDVGTRHTAERQERTLAEVLERFAHGGRHAPVLDWTDLDLGPVVPGRNVFTVAAETDGELPHLDRTIDVVVVEDRARVEEARRVASGAVIVVSPHESGRVEVAEVQEVRAEGARATDPVLIVVAASDLEDPWLARVGEAVAEQPAVSVVPSTDPWATATAADSDVVILAERGVLPLPGCIEAASATLESGEEVGAAAVKLLAADGSLEAAGSMVFADASVAGVAAGCEGVAAPWHEYVRPVCAATGVLAVRTSAAREVSKRSGSFVALSAGLWEAGYEMLYQPDAWAVRALDLEREDGADDEADARAWSPALPARPYRPIPLDERAWRMLLARDDVEACWR